MPAKADFKMIGQSLAAVKNVFETYAFDYRQDVPGFHADSGRFIGVMAQDLLPTHPEAVVLMPNGYYAVDYSKIKVEFRPAG